MVKIDLDGLNQRILSLPVAARDYLSLQTAEGKLFYLETVPHQLLSYQCFYQLKYFDLKERKEEIFLDRVQGYWISADGKKLLYRAAGEMRFAIVGTDKKPEPADGWLNLDAWDVAVDPKAEWRQIFHEAYRIHRDYFYDAGMHGLDWGAAYQKYLPFLEHVGHRDDLNYLLAEFSGELVVGHAYVVGGDIPAGEAVPVGLLGADYEVTPEGIYRIQHIYPGLNWHPSCVHHLPNPESM